jgi:predicted permease
MPAALRRLLARFGALFRASALDRDFDDELRSHVAMLTEENIRRGMAHEAARRAALLDLGSTATLAERHRDLRGVPALHTLARDLRSAWRSVVAHPVHTVPVVITLALGIGVTTALFSMLDSALWRRVPFADAARLVEIWNHFYEPQEFYGRGSSREQVIAWRDQTDLFDWVEAYKPASVVYQADSRAHLIDGALVTPALFRRLGVSAERGRTFRDDEGRAGTSLKALLSHAFWTRELLRDPDVLARTISLDGVPYAVLGVMPAAFRFPDAATEIWLPYDASAPPRAGDGPDRQSSRPTLVPVAHIKEGTFQHIDEVVRARGDRVNAGAGRTQTMGALLYRFGRDADASTRQVLLLLGGAVLLLLLIVCVNVAALTLSRDLARSHVVAVRAALGASRWTLLRENLFEHLLTGLAGAVAGAAVASGVLRIVLAFVPTSLADATVNPVDLDGRVLAFAAAAGLLSGLLFGLPTAVRASAASVTGMLRRDGRNASESRWSRHVRTVLVGAQVCLSLVLLVGAGLMARSVSALYAADRGFVPDGLVRIRVGLPQAGYADADRRDPFVEDAVAALRAVPGVENATAGEIPPTSSKILLGTLEIGGRSALDERYRPRADLFEVFPDYFSTLGIPLLEGATFQNDHPAGAVVVSEAFARAHWPDGSAVGQQFRLNDDGWRTVVGVVADVRRVTVGDAARRPQVYHRAGRAYEGGIGTSVRRTSILAEECTLVVRLADRGPSRQRLVDAVTQADSSVIVRTDSVEDLIGGENARSRLVLLLMSGFAALALFVSAAGLYGLMSYAVEQRLREIGIRIALGAEPRMIGYRVLSRALVLTVAAVGAGLGTSLTFGKLLESELYGVLPSDPLTLAVVSIVLVITAVVAAWRPAAQATRVDPAALLRGE